MLRVPEIHSYYLPEFNIIEVNFTIVKCTELTQRMIFQGSELSQIKPNFLWHRQEHVCSLKSTVLPDFDLLSPSSFGSGVNHEESIFPSFSSVLKTANSISPQTHPHKILHMERD